MLHTFSYPRLPSPLTTHSKRQTYISSCSEGRPINQWTGNGGDVIDKSRHHNFAHGESKPSTPHPSCQRFPRGLCCRWVCDAVLAVQIKPTAKAIARFGFQHVGTRTVLLYTSLAKPQVSGLGKIVHNSTRTNFPRTSCAKCMVRVSISVRMLYYYNARIRKPERAHNERALASSTLYRAPSS